MNNKLYKLLDSVNITKRLKLLLNDYVKDLNTEEIDGTINITQDTSGYRVSANFTDKCRNRITKNFNSFAKAGPIKGDISVLAKIIVKTDMYKKELEFTHRFNFCSYVAYPEHLQQDFYSSDILFAPCDEDNGECTITGVIVTYNSWNYLNAKAIKIKTS